MRRLLHLPSMEESYLDTFKLFTPSRGHGANVGEFLQRQIAARRQPALKTLSGPKLFRLPIGIEGEPLFVTIGRHKAVPRHAPLHPRHEALIFWVGT